MTAYIYPPTSGISYKQHSGIPNDKILVSQYPEDGINYKLSEITALIFLYTTIKYKYSSII